MEPNLQAIHIDKRFPGVNALTDVSIDFYPGEVHALLGENGAGKSTLIKILSGVYTPTSGKVVFEGNEMHFTAPGEALNKGIAVIHQELSIANDLTVAENVFLGAEPRINNGPLLDRAKMNRDTQALLDYMKVTNIKATDIARDLTAAQQQMVEIAKVISKKAKVVIMDEPTSSLSEHEINALFEQLDNLRNNQVTVIYISHRMAEIFRMCDRATILRDGCKVKTCMIKDTTESEIVNSMVGREIKDYYNRQAHTPGKEMLRVEGLTRKKEFKDISFSYDGSRQVLKHINLTVPKGKTIALVGQSGSGKSTLVDLLPRYHDVQSGKILIDGLDIKDARIADLRGLIGNVNQEAILFNDTFFNNIAFGVENATMEQVVEAAKIANAHDFIMDTEKGYDTNIGDRGGKLSGGQRQRISIARAILKNPPILILDEATSALDTESERLVQEALERLMKTRTTIAIAHRLSTIRNADEICVLYEGEIVERGRHEELLAKDGYYKKLNDMQSLG